MAVDSAVLLTVDRAGDKLAEAVEEAATALIVGEFLSDAALLRKDRVPRGNAGELGIESFPVACCWRAGLAGGEEALLLFLLLWLLSLLLICFSETFSAVSAAAANSREVEGSILM